MRSEQLASACSSDDESRLSSVITDQASRGTSVARSRRRFLSPAIAVLTGALLAGCAAETAPAERPPRPVQVASVVFEEDAVSRDFAGVIEPASETDLAFRIGGKLTARLVDTGARVAAGQAIARLDAEDLMLQLESAEAELAAATSSLAQASADLDRYEALKDRGHATAADHDRKRLARDEAAARLERASRALELARRQVGYAELRAETDGIVTATLAEPGQVVAVGQPIVRLASLDGREAVIALPEDWFGAAGEAKATVSLWADGQRRFAARLSELSPAADPITRTYAARFALANADQAAAIGMTATVRLTRPGRGAVARLPLGAVLNTGRGPAVFVVEADGTLALKPVTVAAFGEETALVSDGVRDGDRVVTLGAQKLEPGARVRTVEAR